MTSRSIPQAQYQLVEKKRIRQNAKKIFYRHHMKLFRITCLLALFWSKSLFSHQSIIVSGIGIACVDYVISVDDSFLNAVDLKKRNCTSFDWPTFSHILQLAKEFNTPYAATGGSTANTLKGLAQLNIPCSLISKAGKDEVATWLKTAFSAAGVQCCFFESALPSSQILCLITSDGERTFCVYQGAESEFSAKDIETIDFSFSKHVHIEGYQFRQDGLVENTIQQAKHQGCTISFDLCDSSITLLYREHIFKNCLPFIDILFANEEEALALTQLPAKEACLALSHYCPIAVVKVGEKGCWVASKEEAFHSPSISAQVVDTTGAGDLFACGFIYGYLHKASLRDSAYYGNLLGSTVVEYKGGEIPLQKWEELRKKIIRKA